MDGCRGVYKVKEELCRYTVKLGYSRDGVAILNEKDERLYWKYQQKASMLCVMTVTRDTSNIMEKSSGSNVQISIFDATGSQCIFVPVSDNLLSHKEFQIKSWNGTFQLNGIRKFV